MSYTFTYQRINIMHGSIAAFYLCRYYKEIKDVCKYPAIRHIENPFNAGCGCYIVAFHSFSLWPVIWRPD